MRVAATYSIKGGVGKTTTAVNLAFEAARAGARVLVWDLDPQGAATYLLRVRAKVKGGSERLVGAKGELASHLRGSDLSSIHVVPADFSLRHLDVHLEGTKHPIERLASLLDPLRDLYDLALLDCPPSISLASESVFRAADALLVPVVPATLGQPHAGPAGGLPRRPGRRPARAPGAVDGGPPQDAAPRARRVAHDAMARRPPHPDPERCHPRAHGRGPSARSASPRRTARRPAPTAPCGPRWPPASGPDLTRGAGRPRPPPRNDPPRRAPAPCPRGG